MSFLTTLLKFFLALVIWTAVGQIPWKGESLENRYHRSVNSEPFQKTFWKIATPVTWTKAKVEKLIENHKERQSQAR